MRLVSSLIACVALGLSGCQKSNRVLPPEAIESGPVIRIAATYPGANAKVAADAVAAPIEQQIKGVEGLVLVESESRDDGSYVATLRFAPKTDIDAAIVLLRNRVNVAQPQLPEEVVRQGVTVRRGDADSFPPVWVALTSTEKTYDVGFLGNYAELKVRHDLARVAGITDVHAVGNTGGQVMRIWIDPERLAARNLTTVDVIAALRQQNVQVAAGQIGQPPKPPGQPFQLTATAGKITEPRQFEEIIVRAGEGGKVVYLRDVAKVELGASGGDGFARVNGKPAVLLTAHTDGEKATVDGVRKAMDKLAETAPKGLTGQVVLDLATERFAVVELRLPDAAAVPRTEEAVARAEKLIRGLSGVAECVAFADRETNVATVLVKLTAKDPATPADIRKALADVREAAVRVSDLAAGRPFPVRLALTDEGDNGLEKLREWADAVAKRLADDGGAVDPDVFPGRAVPRTYFDIDREKAEKLGVKVDDIFSTIQAHFGSVYVSDFNQFGRTYQVRVQAYVNRMKPEEIKKLKVRGREGEMVALGTVMAMREVTAPPAALRVNLHPAARITAAVPEGKTVAEVAAKCAEVAEDVRKKLKLPDTFKAVDTTTAKPK